MNPAITAALLKQATELETLLFNLHRDSGDYVEKNQLGVAWISAKEMRVALQLVDRKPDAECNTGDPAFIRDMRTCDKCGGPLGSDYHSQVYDEGAGVKVAECRCKKCDAALGKP